ncbi:MAG: hypothetical protein U0457_15385 [Candidatus Sericytochromatia bacterium]
MNNRSINEINYFLNNLDISKYLNNEFSEYISFICALCKKVAILINLMQYLSNNIIKKKLILSIIRIFYNNQDKESLLKIAPLTFRNSKLIDYLVAHLLLIIKDENDIYTITKFILG